MCCLHGGVLEYCQSALFDICFGTCLIKRVMRLEKVASPVGPVTPYGTRFITWFMKIDGAAPCGTLVPDRNETIKLL